MTMGWGWLRATLLGVVAGVVAFAVRVLPDRVAGWASGANGFTSNVFWAIVFLLVGGVTIGWIHSLQAKLVRASDRSRRYEGISDVLSHISSPARLDPPSLWGARAILSALLAIFTRGSGPEGAAIEVAQGTVGASRPKSFRWLEQRRRTDGVCALAAGVAAAFNAPFAAVILATELNAGGRVLSAAISAISAAYVSSSLFVEFSAAPGSHYGMGLGNIWAEPVAVHFRSGSLPRELLLLVLIGLAVGGSCVLLVRGISAARSSLQDLFGARVWAQMTLGLVLLTAVFLIHSGRLIPMDTVLRESFMTESWNSWELSSMLAMQVLSWVLVACCFGSSGALWPLFAFGAMLGVWVDQASGLSSVGSQHWGVWIGGGVSWAVLLGAPWSAGILIWELSHSPILSVGVLGISWFWIEILRRMGFSNWIVEGMRLNGSSVREGRSQDVLSSIPVEDAMVRDFESAHEHDPVRDLYEKMKRATLPVLPVSTAQGKYLGILTVDMILDGLHAEQSTLRNDRGSLVRLLEAKDLLYRAGVKHPVLRVGGHCGEASRLLDESPCVAILSSQDRLVGLLFSHSIRNAYDRQLARASLELAHAESG